MKKRVIKLMCFLFSASLIWGLGGQYVRAAEVTELPEVAAQEAIKNNEDDFVIKNGVLKQYKGSDEVVYVPEGVQVVGKYAFRDVRSIREIHFPDTVTEIGYTKSEYGFDANTCAVLVAIDEQSADIAYYSI